MTTFGANGVMWRIHEHGERRRAEIMAHLLEPKFDDSILDVGCGDGYQTSYIVGRVSYVVGVDISLENLKEAKKRLMSGDVVCASSEKLPFQSQIFDKIICLELLEHLKNPNKTLREIELVLKRSGILVVSVPYKELIRLTLCIHCGKLTPLYGHLHSFDEQKVSSILPDNLTTLKRVYTCTPVAGFPIFSFLPIRLWKLVDYLSRVLLGMRPSWFINKFQKI